jgi:hypothetical protein
MGRSEAEGHSRGAKRRRLRGTVLRAVPSDGEQHDLSTRELQETLSALRAELQRAAALRGEARRVYGALLPRFLSRLLSEADAVALEAERLCRRAEELSRRAG